MAEVLKKTVEDKYNTESIKKSLKKDKKDKKESKKVENHSKKEDKKKSILDGLRSFFLGVSTEFKRVHWTTKENMIKYSIATVFFIFFFGIFFYIIDVLFALIQSLF